ncbi:uncharacterized protein LOC143034681 [Oratosquilla oratoria]|uniref:uncharacterized protein LOC143034681 n=1 Tax=Oratosquilla oratoria TaxID=337810 RepID=UPI003F7619BE
MENAQVKLPSFSRDLEIWLVHTEAYLATQGNVPDHQAFGAYIAALPTDVIALVRNVVSSPPQEGKCSALKTALRKLYTRPDDQLYRDIQHSELGGTTPSQLYTRMAVLNTRAKVLLPKQLLRSIHLSKMPDALHLHLEALAGDKDDEQYCEIADKLYQRHISVQVSPYNVRSATSFYPSDKPVHSVQCSDDPGVSDDSSVSENIPVSYSANDQSVQQLRQEAEKGSYQPPRSPAPRQDTASCWYHTRFGAKALRCTQPCSWSQGNSKLRGSVTTPTPANHTHTLLSVRDSHFGLTFLVDTSSAVSIIPPTEEPNHGTCWPSYDLLAANGTLIATYDSHHSVLDLHDVKFPWAFVIAAVQQPILGYDFLQHYNMVISAMDN